jgi:transcriptional regulator of arginine metabolism
MKNKRQELILELIESSDIETQDDLAALLKSRGIDVTQATISRDIKDLRLIKTLSDKGVYKYIPAENGDVRNQSALIRIFSDTVTSVESAGNLIVIRTLTGTANAAAEALDSLHWTEVCGSIAGDNTIFVALRDGVNMTDVVRKLKRMSK